MKFFSKKFNLFVIKPSIYDDNRGYFYESFNEEKFIQELEDGTHILVDSLSPESPR